MERPIDTPPRARASKVAVLAAGLVLILGACSGSSPATPTQAAAATAGASTGSVGAAVTPHPNATPIGAPCISKSTTPPPAADLVAAAQARALISYNAPSAWTGPTSAPKPQAGKKIAIVSVAQLTEGANRAARGMEASAKAAGFVPTIFDGQGKTDVALAAINSAVDSKYDGIMTIFIDPDSVSEALNRAKAANIPVVTLGQPNFTATRSEQWGWIPDISHDWTYTGEVIGDYMIWKSNGHVNAFLLDGAETTVVHCGQFKGTFERLLAQSACPDCKATVQTFTFDQLTAATPQNAIAAVQSDPTINWVWCYDFCMANVAKQMVAANVGANVKGAGFDCNAENIQLIKDSKIQVVCIADPRDWEAWAATDILNRLIQGQPAVDQKIPVRLFDKDNANEFTDADAKNGWQGGFDYQSEYKKIWGVQ